jgi:competence protein ComEA
LAEIAPYFKFPAWVNQPRKQRFSTTTKNRLPPAKEKRQDINKASAEDLQEVYGIGPTFSERIVSYREKIGGFKQEGQLHEVWGLKPATIDELLKYFTVKTPRPLQRYDINKASASDIATIPGISFELAKEIWEFRMLRERIDSLAELQKIEAITARHFKLIQLYLSVD